MRMGDGGHHHHVVEQPIRKFPLWSTPRNKVYDGEEELDELELEKRARGLKIKEVWG